MWLKQESCTKNTIGNFFPSYTVKKIGQIKCPTFTQHGANSQHAHLLGTILVMFDEQSVYPSLGGNRTVSTIGYMKLTFNWETFV